METRERRRIEPHPVGLPIRRRGGPPVELLVAGKRQPQGAFLPGSEHLGGKESFRVDINSVVVKEDVTTLTMTFTNMGPAIGIWWMSAFGDHKMLSDDVKLIDYSRHLVYSPGKAEDGTCICSGRQSSGLDTGESRTVYTTFKGLPADLTKVDVEIKGVGTPFENVPVTRE